MNKNIAIIFGGTSPEYNVSLNSAFSVITNLDNYNLYKIAIAPNGSFYLFEGDNRLIPEDKWQNYTKTLSVNLSENCFICDGKKIKIDLIIPMIHGESGEDGSIQALGKIMNIKVLGSGILSSALCLDKYRSHLLAQSINIKTANSILLKKGDQVDIGHLKYPLFIKPVHAGSSYGISKVYKEFHNSLLRLPLLILLLFPGYCSRAGTFGTKNAVRKRGSSRNLLDCNCIFYCST